MATACLFIAWNHPIHGREADAYRMLTEDALEQIESFKREGWFEDYEVVGLTPHSGTTNSFVLLKGERQKLDELRRTDGFEAFSMKLGRLLAGYGVIPGLTLAGLRKFAERNPSLYK